MNLLTLKLILAPLIIGGASLAGRKWGHSVSGWLIGLPLSSGPIAFFVALSNGEVFAASTVLGTISGGLALVGFCLAYAWLALRHHWLIAITGSMTCFAAITLVLNNLELPLPIIFGLVVLAIYLGLKGMPRTAQPEIQHSKPGKWDIPVRILIGTSFILGLTGIAPFIGPRLTGLLSTIPLYTAILTIFAQRLQGPASAASVLRGLLFGLFGFAGFYLVLALLLGNVPLGLAFLAAILATLAIQGLTLPVMRNDSAKHL